MRRRWGPLVLLVVLATGCGHHQRLVVVPKVNGTPVEHALKKLHLQGLRATFASAHVACGNTDLPYVEHQAPRAGARVAAGSAVSFRVGISLIPTPLIPNGPHPRWVVVPSMLGMTPQGAARAMPGPVWPCLRIHGGTDIGASALVVRRQAPAPGTRVRAYGIRKRDGFHMTTVRLVFEPRSASSASLAHVAPTTAQALRTCADRWNQGNMADWGPALASLGYRRLTRASLSAVGVSNPAVRHCVVAVAPEFRHKECPGVEPVPGHAGWCVDRSNSYVCVLTSRGAYVCPSNEEGSPALGHQNATIATDGRLETSLALPGTRAPSLLPWQRYEHRDGYILQPWLPSGKVRPGLRVIVHRGAVGRCLVGSYAVGKGRALMCVAMRGPLTGTRIDPCFPRQRGWGSGTIAACGAPGSTRFWRWHITGRS
jgi:hypothetical protein